MSSPASWEPFRSSDRAGAPSRSAGPPQDFSRRLVIPPFTWLARTHAAAAAGDAAVAISLAGSLFFDISPQAARGKVALYLLLTMAPFAVVAPLLGPALDRMQGGRRLMVVISCAGRAVVTAFLVVNISSLWLFPLAFLFLVLAKAYADLQERAGAHRGGATTRSWSRPTPSSACWPASPASWSCCPRCCSS